MPDVGMAGMQAGRHTNVKAAKSGRMRGYMDIQLFDNFEDDGQLSMFDMGEDIENLQTLAVEEAPAQEELPASGSAGVRIQKCSSCGKLLFVKEEDGCYVSLCNACGVKYLQKM